MPPSSEAAPTEIEAKFRIDRLTRESLVERLNVDGRSVTTSLQRDEYYDDKRKTLEREDFTVRLRLIGGRDGRPVLALKGPRYQSQLGHSRLELEFTASSEAEVRDELGRKGLRLQSVIEKRRTRAAWGEATVVLDEVAQLGWFCEVEVSSEAELKVVVGDLGLDVSSQVRSNYTELLLESGITDPLGKIALRAVFGAE